MNSLLWFIFSTSSAITNCVYSFFSFRSSSSWRNRFFLLDLWTNWATRFWLILYTGQCLRAFSTGSTLNKRCPLCHQLSKLFDGPFITSNWLVFPLQSPEMELLDHRAASFSPSTAPVLLAFECLWNSSSAYSLANLFLAVLTRLDFVPELQNSCDIVWLQLRSSSICSP